MGVAAVSVSPYKAIFGPFSSLDQREKLPFESGVVNLPRSRAEECIVSMHRPEKVFAPPLFSRNISMKAFRPRESVVSGIVVVANRFFFLSSSFAFCLHPTKRALQVEVSETLTPSRFAVTEKRTEREGDWFQFPFQTDVKPPLILLLGKINIPPR